MVCFSSEFFGRRRAGASHIICANKKGKQAQAWMPLMRSTITDAHRLIMMCECVCVCAHGQTAHVCFHTENNKSMII